jgi:hypothetical protein
MAMERVYYAEDSAQRPFLNLLNNRLILLRLLHLSMYHSVF